MMRFRRRQRDFGRLQRTVRRVADDLRLSGRRGDQSGGNRHRGGSGVHTGYVPRAALAAGDDGQPPDFALRQYDRFVPYRRQAADDVERRAVTLVAGEDERIFGDRQQR